MYNTLKHFYNLHVHLPAIRYPKLYCPLPSIILVQLNIVLQFPIYITCEVSVFCQILLANSNYTSYDTRTELFQ